MAGKPDHSFGKSGRVTVDLTGSHNEYDSAAAIAITGDDRILAAGSVEEAFGAVVKCLPDGHRSSQFGKNGITTTGSAIYFESSDILLQADGKILLIGTGNAPSHASRFTLVRFLPDGRMDASFHQDGIRTISFSMTRSSAHAAALTANNRLVAVGSASGPRGATEVAIARVLLD